VIESRLRVQIFMPRDTTAAEFTAESLERLAAQMPPSKRVEADELRRAASTYRELGGKKKIVVWEEEELGSEALRAGDTVQLKHGGPIMTIDLIAKFGMGSAHESARCIWYDGKKQVQQVFELASLKKV
jgi:uncharacterized protein YodC (DUF2158 family)